MRILSYNLRCADDPNGHSIAERAPRVLDIIKDYDPDIMGFQEVVPKWMKELEVLDDQFDHLLTYRHPNNPEGTPIFWRKDRFELVREEAFWLSPTPEMPSKGWPDCYGLPRVCLLAVLRDLKTGKLIHYYNTHTENGEWNLRESGQLIIRRAQKLGKDAAVFCTADFNFCPDSCGWHSMRSYFRDVRTDIAPDNHQATLNCYEVQGDKLCWLIDHCFYRGKGVKPTKYEVITRLYDGKFPSDHYGMVYDFEFED